MSVKPEEIGPHANLPFHFETHGASPIVDRDGEEFADKSAAYAHATEVARDIMRNREAKCRAYRLQVRDENLEPCFEILFASIDEALNHLPDDLRHRVEEAAHATATLNDTVEQVKANGRWWNSSPQVRSAANELMGGLGLQVGLQLFL